MTGHYRFAVHPGVSDPAFESQAKSALIDGDVLQLTRVTSGFSHRLLRAADSHNPPEEDDRSAPTQYVWEVVVTLVQGGYDFDQNAQRVQKGVADLATLIGVAAFADVDVGE